MRQTIPLKARSRDYQNSIFAWVSIALMIITAFVRYVILGIIAEAGYPVGLGAMLLFLMFNAIITLVLIIVFIFINKGKQNHKRSIFWFALSMIILYAFAPWIIWPNISL